MLNVSRSGDLLADKRFAYAEALAAEGDWAAAADLYEQAAIQAPGWAAARFALGAALERIGEARRAEQAFAEAERLDRDDVLGARLHRLRVAGRRADTLPQAYVAALFDQYAGRFDAHLVDRLGYAGPAVILSCLAGLDRPVPGGAALDLGCGTGLMARALGGRADPIDGIDLSPAMVGKARETGLYRSLTVGDAAAVAATLPSASYAAVYAADVLVYLGDLVPVVGAVARLLVSGGLFAATVQAGDQDGFALGDDLRFRHGAAYLRRVLASTGLACLALDPCVTRREAGRDVPGLVFVAAAA